MPTLSVRELLAARGTRIAGGKSGLPHLTVGEGGGSAGSGALGGGARGIGQRISRRRLVTLLETSHTWVQILTA